MAVATKQISFSLPAESQMYRFFIDRGIYKGTWEVDTQLLKTSEGKTFIPFNERLTLIEAYHKILTDKSLVDAGLQPVPVPVMIAGIQHERDFYKKILDTYQLTGSGVVGQNNKYILGTPRIVVDNGLQFNELRSDEPVARIEPQNGKVTRLDTTAFWGISADSKIESEKVRQDTFMWNAEGARFVGLYVRSYGDVVAYADGRPWGGGFGRGARSARKLD